MKKFKATIPAEKNYVILGDNNLWLGTFYGTEKEAKKFLKNVKYTVNSGNYDGEDVMPDATQLYLHEVKEIQRVTV